MKRSSTIFLVQSALIAALYAALTYLASILNLAYGPIQFRFSEALTVLPALTPAAIPGLAIGCFLGNLASPYPLDMLFGTAATLLAALCTYYTRKIRFRGMPLLGLLFPVLFNAWIVGMQIALFTPGEAASLTGFLIAAAQVGAGELLVCYVLGLPLFAALRNAKLPQGMPR